MSNTLTVDQLASTLTVSEGQPMAKSTDVAKVFNKLHKNVLRDIDNLEVPREWHRLNFEPDVAACRTGIGETRNVRAYWMTRDGFTILAMGFTGKKAMQFKIAYIEAFNRMEKQLHEQRQQPEPPEVFLPEAECPIRDGCVTLSAQQLQDVPAGALNLLAEIMEQSDRLRFRPEDLSVSDRQIRRCLYLLRKAGICSYRHQRGSPWYQLIPLPRREGMLAELSDYDLRECAAAIYGYADDVDPGSIVAFAEAALNVGKVKQAQNLLSILRQSM